MSHRDASFSATQLRSSHLCCRMDHARASVRRTTASFKSASGRSGRIKIEKRPWAPESTRSYSRQTAEVTTLRLGTGSRQVFTNVSASAVFGRSEEHTSELQS